MEGAGGMTAQRRRLRDAAPGSQGGVSGPRGTASEPARKLYGENGDRHEGRKNKVCL